MEDELVKHDDPRINVAGLPIPEGVKRDVLMLDLLPKRFWVVSYDENKDEIRVADPDGITSISPRNDGRSNDGLRVAAEQVGNDYDHEVWFDESTWGLDGFSDDYDQLVNFNHDDWDDSLYESGPIGEDAFKRATSRLAVIQTRAGILEQLLHAMSSLRAFRNYTYKQWSQNRNNTILSYEYLDNHPLGWSVDRGWSGRPIISTESRFSRMVGWQTFFYGGGGSDLSDDSAPMLEVEPLMTVHDTRLDHISNDMDDMIVTLAGRIDRYYNPDGSERVNPLNDSD